MKKTPPLLILDFVTLLCLPYPGLAVSPIDGYAKWGLDFGAESLVPSHLPDYDINRYGDGILVTTHAAPVTIAHELLYLLLNAGHHDYDRVQQQSHAVERDRGTM
jgi:hypothetical protein